MKSILDKLQHHIKQIEILMHQIPINTQGQQSKTHLEELYLKLKEYFTLQINQKIDQQDKQGADYDLLSVLKCLNGSTELMEVSKEALDTESHFLLNDCKSEINQEAKPNKVTKKPRAIYKKYSKEFKKETVELLKQTNFDYKTVFGITNVPKKNLKRWFQNGHIQRTGGVRRAFFHELENKLHEWILTRHGISKKLIKEKAEEFSLNSEYSASRGWLKRFIERYNLEINI